MEPVATDDVFKADPGGFPRRGACAARAASPDTRSNDEK